MRSKKKTEELLLTAFGARIRQLRKDKRFSQEEIGLRADLSSNQVGRIERGEINTSLLVIYRLAEALDVQPHELIDKWPEKG